MPEIKIFIACHKDCEAIQNEILQPIQVGAALSAKRIEGFLHDDEGENISAKNKRYCELTAQYWAWKHCDADYIGFMHYRRYFSFSEDKLHADAFNNVWYETVRGAHERDLCLQEEEIRRIVESCDIVVPYEMDLNTCGSNANTVYKHYATSPAHSIKDYDFCCDYIRVYYPDYISALEEYNASSRAYFLNMYVMRRELFQGYCEWLFPILDAFDLQRDYTNDSVAEKRTPGFLAERLFGVWFTQLLKKSPTLRVRYAQTSFVRNTEEEEISPAFSADSVAVCLGADNHYAPFAELVISSIAANASPTRNYDIVVFSNGIAQMKQDAIARSLVGVSNIRVRFVESAAYLTGPLVERGHINKSAYLRFIIPKAMRRFPKVVYLDCDLVVNHDIAELYDTDLAGCYIGAVRDTVDAGWIKFKFDDTEKNIAIRLGLQDVFDYINSGVLVFDIKRFNALYPTDELFSLAITRSWVWQDQDILNYLCRGKVQFLDQRWNVLAHDHETFAQMEEQGAPQWLYEKYMAARKDPYIVHYCGRQQPCYRPNVDLREYFWKYARNCGAYETLLAYQAAEFTGKALELRRSFGFRAKRLIKKGFVSLKRDGLSVTYRRVKRKLNALKPQFMAKKAKRPAVQGKTVVLRAAGEKLLCLFEKACAAAGCDYWLLGESLLASAHGKLFYGGNDRICVGMLRDDFEKLKNSFTEKKAEVFADFGTRGARFGVRFKKFPAFDLEIFVFDELRCTPAYENWLVRNEVRCEYVAAGGGEAGASGMAAALAARIKESSGTSLVLGAENLQSCYVQIFAKECIFPVRQTKCEGKTVRLPAKSQDVLRTLYLGWEHINASPARWLCNAEESALKQFLKEF